MFPSTLQHFSIFKIILTIFEAADTLSNNSVSYNSPEAEQQEIFEFAMTTITVKQIVVKQILKTKWQTLATPARHGLMVIVILRSHKLN